MHPLVATFSKPSHFSQVVHLLLEKGQLPLDSLHAPLTPQSTSELQNKPDAHSAAAPEPKPVKKAEYNFVKPGGHRAAIHAWKRKSVYCKSFVFPDQITHSRWVW